MDSCIFCKIVNGEIPSVKVYEQEDVLVFLDVSPLTQGHCLVIPKQHFENIFDIDQEVLKKIIVVAKNISEKIKTHLQADGIRLAQSNGKAAHQEVMHFHLHIIPRYKNDVLAINEQGHATPPNIDMQELKKIADKIGASI